MAKHTLAQATSKVSSMTFISRTLGFVRDLTAAQVYGVNAAVDAFNIAFKVPNLLRNLFSEGSFAQAFVPTLSQYRYQQTEIIIQKFINDFAGLLSFILLMLTMIGMIFAPFWITIISPGLEPLRHLYATQMLRITFPYLFFIVLTAFCASILNSYSKFMLAAFVPAVLNIVLIMFALFASHWFAIPVFAQAYGVCIAGILQFLLLIPTLIQHHLLPKPSLHWQNPEVKRVLRKMLPAIFGASVGQLNLFLNTIFASFLSVGSVSFLYYSERLAYFPQGVFGVALATVVMPHLTKHFAKSAEQHFRTVLAWGLQINLLVGIPASLVLLLFAGPIVITLFQHGHFTPHDALKTHLSVMTYAVGLQAFMLVKLLSSACYARQDIKAPVRIALFVLFANIILNALFLKPFGHAGLALATSLAAWLNVGLLIFNLINAKAWPKLLQNYKFFLRLLAANFSLVVLLLLLKGSLAHWFAWNGFERLTHLSAWLILSIIFYLAVLWLFGMRPKDLTLIEFVDL